MWGKLGGEPQPDLVKHYGYAGTIFVGIQNLWMIDERAQRCVALAHSLYKDTLKAFDKV